LLDGPMSQQPPYPPALTLRGRIALESGEFTEAETYLRQAIALNPPDRRARSSLVLCLLRNGKQAEAQQQQQELEQRDKDLARFNEIVTKEMAQRPRDPALHCALGQLLLRMGHGEEGLRWLTSALRLDTDYAPAREAMSEYYEKRKSEPQKG